MAAADGLDERRPVVIAGIAWDVLVLVVMVYLAFADPLAIGMLQHFAIPALDVFATVVLVIDVPRQALAIVLAHRRELVENAYAAKLERRSAKEDDVDEDPPRLCRFHHLTNHLPNPAARGIHSHLQNALLSNRSSRPCTS